MKRHILLSILGCLLLSATSAPACEFCGCLMGLNPFYSPSNTLALHFIHQKWIYNHQPEPGVGGSKINAAYGGISPGLFHGNHAEGAGTLSQARRTVEFAYRHHLASDVLAVAIVPYVSTTTVTDHGTATMSGIGDPMLLGYYVMRGNVGQSLPATLLVGGGITVPAGEYRSADGTATDPHALPGTGSVDVLMNVTGTLQTAGWTFGLDAFGRLATANSLDTRLGSSLTMALTTNRDILRDNENMFAIVGIAGARGEVTSDDRIAGVLDAGSGHGEAFGMLGAQIVLDSWKLDLSALIPVIGNGANEPHREQTRLVAGIRYEL